VDKHHNFDRTRYTAHLQTMHRIRAFENAALRAHKEGLVLGAIHPSIGQEAVASGVCSNLQITDLLLSTHRGHGHTLAKGASAEAMMRELFGRSGGACQGKGGSMHIADFAVGMLGANGVVGANITIAAGAAHALKLQGFNDRVVTCIFGDGAINRGPFLEGLNWAKIYQLPVLFVCEDNTYAATTRTETLTGGAGAAARAESLGIPAVTIDGNNIIEVDETTRRLLDTVRNGAGPHFLVAKTYRLTGHTGSDSATYRSNEEVEANRQRDPISRCQALLKESGVSEQALTDGQQKAVAEMDAAYTAAKNAAWPAQELAYTDVQDIGHPAERAY
jgi:pyruvate dehydrogenase E1 component alpha subunit